MYRIVQDEELWRQVARRVWRKDGATHDLRGKWGTLQRMCMARPRVHYHGVYITRYQYTRRGERTWDSFYTPQHQVVYYRYLRCFADGTAIVVTSTDHPDVMVPKLKHPSRLQHRRDNFLGGTWSVEGDLVTVRASRVVVDLEVPPHRHAHNRQIRSQRHLLEITARIENRRRTFSTRLGVLRWDTAVVRDGDPSPPVWAHMEIGRMLPFMFSRVKSIT